MFCNPFARLILLSALFLITFVLIDDWISITMRNVTNRKRMTSNNKEE